MEVPRGRGHFVGVPTITRRLAFLVLAATLVVPALAAPPRAAAADLSVAGAEAEVLRLLNEERTKAGLVPYRADSRLMAIARARSTDMASQDYFSHTSPDGTSAFDLIGRARITWYAAGEIIAWNNWPGLGDSAAAAVRGWMNSTGHRGIVLSTTYNYVGVGLAVTADGDRYWTAVTIRGPDRTQAWAKLATTSTVARYRTYRVDRVRWSGGDVRLQVLTAGLRSYQVQKRRVGASWVWLSTGTTATSKNVNIVRGLTYDVRIRACDKAGNCSAWTTVRIKG